MADQCRSGVLRRAGPARVGGHDVPAALRRAGRHRPRAVRRRRGAARGRSAGRRALVRRPADRPQPAQARDGRAARAVPARDRGRPLLLRHRHERARQRLGPRLDPDNSRPLRPGVGDQRPQDLDLERPPGRAPARARANRVGWEFGPARGPDPAHRADRQRRHHGLARHHPGRPPPPQRDHLRRRARRSLAHPRPGGRRLGPGHRRARVRTLGTGAVPVQLRAAAGVRPHRARGRRPGPARRVRTPEQRADRTARDVGPGRRGARPGRDPGGRRGAGEGRGHDLRLVDGAARPRRGADGCGADGRGGVGAPAGTGRTRLAELLDEAQLLLPAYTIRGGTNEILRGIVARGLRP